ncbi:MAG: DUF3365 domain-containing protein [Pirellulales bacterium]|nr:hypothetical protein [Planctomycetales bacterium]
MMRHSLIVFSAMAMLATAAWLVNRHTMVHADEPAAAVGGEKAAPPSAPPSDAAIKRAHKQVEMLDNIYKQAIVLITDKYVHDEDDFAAGSAAVLLFKNISEGGSHQVRLIDVSGLPYDDENVANDDFERAGVKELKAGAPIFERVEQIDGRPQLRALTTVPVVMKKCVMCHEHYADVKPGKPIGAISYTVPIE